MKPYHVLLSIFFAVPVLADKQATELGTVKWSRDFDATLAKAKKSGKPVFLLFQEVPGWKGCRDFGSEVLSNAALVKLIETEFEPVAVANNKRGKDAEILKRFKEPSWNFQVVRYIDAKGKDIIPRRKSPRTIRDVSVGMKKTLEKLKRPVPVELKKLAK